MKNERVVGITDIHSNQVLSLSQQEKFSPAQITCNAHITYSPLNVHNPLPQHNENIKMIQESITLWYSRTLRECLRTLKSWMSIKQHHTLGQKLVNSFQELLDFWQISRISFFFFGGGGLWRCDPTWVMASSFLRFSRSHTTTHHSR